MNVLSLFDGMSGGQLALNRANIKYNKYFASEIDKYAIKVAQANFPNTVQLGDVTKISRKTLLEDLPKIDLLIGGSPCQGFSVAGKHLNFDDPRSKLFFEFFRILDVLYIRNPNLKFILENVKMKKEWQDIISTYLGVEPVLIDSALVSAQTRKRLYWANFPITQPEDKGILLKDIIEDGEVDRDKAYTLDACYYKGGSVDTLKRLYFTKHRRQVVRQSAKHMVVKVGSQDILDDAHYRKLTPLECERLQTVPDNYTNYVSNTQRYKMLGNGFTVDVVAHILREI